MTWKKSWKMGWQRYSKKRTLSAQPRSIPPKPGIGRQFIRLQLLPIAWQLDGKGGSTAALAMYADPASVVTDHRLDDGQPQPCSMRLARVVRREQAFTLLSRQPGAGVGNLRLWRDALILSSARGQRASLRHCIQRIQRKIGKRPVQQFRIRRNRLQRLGKFKPALDRRALF